MEENLSSQESFAPSIFDAVKTYATPETSGTVVPDKRIEIDQETSEILVQVPFDIASYLTKTNEIKLTEPEFQKLGTLWRKPLERLLSQYENSDIAVAAIATLGIAGEKYVEYLATHPERGTSSGNGSGNEGKRKD